MTSSRIAARFAPLAAALLLLTACGSPAADGDPSATSAAPETTSVSVPEVSETPVTYPTWPLTGLPQAAGEGQTLYTPVIGVKVENTAAARPWVGLADADVVFVEMVEGGLTRFHAIYNSRIPDVVGPVRSLRPMDAGLLAPLGGVLFASGGQLQFIARVESVVEVRMEDSGDAGFFRDGERSAPHNLFIDAAGIVAGLTPPASITPLFTYGDQPSTVGGTGIGVIDVGYPSASSTWVFDGATSTYLRSDDGTDSVDADGTRISATNVLVLNVTTQDTGAHDAAGNPVPETVLTGSGTLTLFSGGAMTTGTWTKGADADPFVFTDAAGAPLVLSPGTTWVELLPTNGTLATR